MSPMVRLPLKIEYALLGFLREEPLHGYEIHHQLSDPAGLGQVWRFKQSQVYALLARLEEEGHVTASIKPQEARPPRKVFQLTKLGCDTFLKWVRTPVSHGRDFRQLFLAKLYFARREGLEITAELIERQRATCRGWLDTHRARSETSGGTRSLERMVGHFRITQIEAMLAWLDECERIAGDA